MIPSPQRESVAEILNRFPEVRWDRMTLDDGTGCGVYGWIERKDLHADFLLIMFRWTEDLTVGFYTSSAALTHTISERLYGADDDAHEDCQRVEDLLGGLVERAIHVG